MRARIGMMAAATLLLAGCAELEALERQQAERQRAEDQATCAGYGFQFGTDNFARCMMQLDQDRERQAYIERRDAEEQQRREQWKAENAYRRNGQCDDARYNTSNGGRAAAGADEYDCKVLGLGDGRK